jgi:hypothetical protein
MIMELLLIDLYTTQMGKPPRRPLLGEMLNDNQFTRKLNDPRIVEMMHVVRGVGNLGPHGPHGTADDAATALERLCEVLEWYCERILPRAQGDILQSS